MTGLPQWAPERSVEAGRAAGLVGRAAPGLRGLPVEPFAEGWDNTVLLVGGRWVARFPRRATALPGFRRELAVLPRIAGRLPLPVPAPAWTGTDDDPAEPWPFAVAPLVAGTELADAALPEPDRSAAAAAVGAFLRALHAPGVRAAVADVGLPVDPLGRGRPRQRAESTREKLRSLADAGFWTADPAVTALLADGERLGAPAGEPVLLHGDLHVRHLLVDADGRAAGVIDWGDVCLGDPAVDLAVAWAAFSGPARRALLSAYGPVDAERALRARCLAVRLSALLADYAAGDGRPALLAESLAGLRRAVA